MGTTTIEGCVNRTTGAITFAGYACDSGDYTGCIVRVGHADYALHPDMVAVTVDEVNCDATYFGCRDLVTGKFKVVIPDDCCNLYPDCLCTQSNYCPLCYPENETPDNLVVIFDGIDGAIDGVPFCMVKSAECATTWEYSHAWAGDVEIEGYYATYLVRTLPSEHSQLTLSGYVCELGGGIFDGEESASCATSFVDWIDGGKTAEIINPCS